MGVWAGHDTSHTHLRRSLYQPIGNQAVSLSDGIERAADRQDPVMDTRHDFANASPDPSLLTQISNIGSRFANDHSSLFRRDDSTECELCLAIFFLGARLVVIGVQSPKSIGDAVHSIDTG